MQKIGIRGWSRVLATILALASLAVCVLNWSELSGLEYGYFYGVFANPPSSGFSGDSPNYFQSINIWYFVIVICLLIYLIAKLLKPPVVSLILCISALSVSVFPLWNMLGFKYEVLEMHSPYYPWLSNSIQLDVLCAAAISITIFIEVILFISRTPAPSRLELGR